MKEREKITFCIDHIDPLGQGVDKQNDQITFIAKTLPGESGTADIVKRSKGVQFAKLHSLTKKSPKRIEPECPHFNECSGCDFLHTDYETEIEIKKSIHKRTFEKLTDEQTEWEFKPAPKRLGYRNRVQLHYHRPSKNLGHYKSKSHQILATPDCKIAMAQVRATIEKLFEKNHWLSLAKDQPSKGHVEIYHKDGKTLTSWNKHYAAEGFTQVNNELNEFLQNFVGEHCLGANYVLDLFSGNGNLTSKVKAEHQFHIDSFDHQIENFSKLDLFKEESLTQAKEILPEFVEKCDVLIVDPPRSGFKQLLEWSECFDPQKIIYVSCGFQTQKRDIAPLVDPLVEKYKITKVLGLDLFSATKHFESILILDKRN